MSNRYFYPSDLDSDDEGSVESDWDDDDDQSQGNRTYSGTSNRANRRAQTPPPGYSTGPPPGYSASNGQNALCIVCNVRPQFNKNGRRYPTCGLTCASQLSNMPTVGGSGFTGGNQGRTRQYHIAHSNSYSSYHVLGGSSANWSQPAPRPPCAICKTKPSSPGYVTCSFACAEKLCKDGGDPTMCDYCHRRPRVTGKQQCGVTCAEKAKVACLLCKCRPRNGKYHLCGKTCKRISTKSSPLILEAPKGHATFEMVEKKFKSGWKAGGTPPEIKKVFKIIENDDFLRPYEAYRKKVGNEHFRYHGTRRQCQLGTTTTICASTTCPVCSILRTSFKVSLARNGCFGPGIYSSSAANKAFGYCSGAMLLTKVVLGKAMDTKNSPGIKACPAGHNSVEHDIGGMSNETIVYTDDAIRPVFLITF